MHPRHPDWAAAYSAAVVQVVAAERLALPSRTYGVLLRPSVRPYTAASHEELLLAMNRAIETNRLTPVIDRVFPFDEAVEAYHYYQAEQPLDKVVIAHP